MYKNDRETRDGKANHSNQEFYKNLVLENILNTN